MTPEELTFEKLKEPAPEIDEDGTKRWFKNGERHRDNGLPAVIYLSGMMCWYKHGLLHRDNKLPAVISSELDAMWVDGNFINLKYKKYKK